MGSAGVAPDAEWEAAPQPAGAAAPPQWEGGEPAQAGWEAAAPEAAAAPAAQYVAPEQFGAAY